MDILTLLKYVKEKGCVTVAEVQRKFCVGYMKARKLFEQLEEKGMVRIEGSGFRYCENAQQENPFEEESSDDEDEEEDEYGDDDIDSRIPDLQEQIERLRERMNKRLAELREIDHDEDNDEDEDEDADEEEDEDPDGDEDELTDDSADGGFDENADTEGLNDEEKEYLHNLRYRREIDKFIKLCDDSEDEGSSSDDDGADDKNASEPKHAGDEERKDMIHDLDTLFEKGEDSGDALLGGELEEKKLELFDKLKDIEAKEEAKGPGGGKFRQLGTRPFITLALSLLTVEEKEFSDNILAELYYPDRTEYSNSLIFDHYFTDNGKTLEYLSESADVADDKVRTAIRHIAAYHDVELVGDQLIMRVKDRMNPFISFARFVVAIKEVSEINV